MFYAKPAKAAVNCNRKLRQDPGAWAGPIGSLRSLRETWLTELRTPRGHPWSWMPSE